jgi:hypothetical protein
VRGRDATNSALATVGVSFPWWGHAKRLVHATSVLYPVFVAISLAVSAWRAHLARTLDIHRPGERGGGGAAREGQHGRPGGPVRPCRWPCCTHALNPRP